MALLKLPLFPYHISYLINPSAVSVENCLSFGLRRTNIRYIPEFPRREWELCYLCRYRVWNSIAMTLCIE